MKRLILLFFSISSLAKAQSCGVIDSPTSIYYANTTTSASIVTNTLGYAVGYLCGPNTIVNDTLLANGCRLYYVNSSCLLTVKIKSCPYVNYICAKSNSTITILPNSTGVCYVEPGAVINNLAGSSMSIISCSTVPFPTVNCFAGINNISNEQKFNIFPNPTSSKISIELLNQDGKSAEIIITNQLGEIVFENKQWSVSEKEIPIENLPNGSYFIRVKTKRGIQTGKLIVLR